MNVTMEEARSSLPELLDRMTAGEEVVITRDGKPVARLVAPESVPLRKGVRLTGRLAEVGADRQLFTLQLADGNFVRGLLGSGSIDELSVLAEMSIVIDGVAAYGAPGGRLYGRSGTASLGRATERRPFDFGCSQGMPRYDGNRNGINHSQLNEQNP